MNYNTDRPIEKKEQDLLGRASFSEHLGRAIYEHNGAEGLTIGLFGKWGTGKTSVINMAVNEINRLAEGNPNKPLIMRFSPWNYSDKNDLIKIFFQDLEKKIDIQDNEDVKKKVGKALSDYSDAFDALEVLPIAGSGVAKIFKNLAKVIGKTISQDRSLDDNRKDLEKALLDSNAKIVVVIDDIDRLTNSQIRDVFQLVKQVADFPNIIYVLVMDKDVVCSALAEVHKINGNEYLEKIIQVPFELPECNKVKLNDIFLSRLEQEVKKIPGGIVVDKAYWSDIYRNCIKPYIKTLRDVNRVINVFQFRYAALHQETSFEDMVAITTLEVLEPSIYKWIYDNKDDLCTGKTVGLMSSVLGRPEDYYKHYHDEFSKMGLNPDPSIKCLSTIFPAFAKKVNKNSFYYYEERSEADIRSKMRVAHEERFDLYFAFDVEDIKVPRSIINACVHELDKDSLKKEIEEIEEQGNIAYYLEEMHSLIEVIPYERLALIASVLLDLQGMFISDSEADFIQIPAVDCADMLISDILKRLKTKDESYEVISQAISVASKAEIGIIARIIIRLELAYNRWPGGTEDIVGQIVSLEHLEKLEMSYVERIKSIISSGPIFDVYGFKFAFRLWERLDKDGVNQYMGEVLKNEILKLKFICALARKWYETEGNGWEFNEKDFEAYISKEEIFTLIRDFDKNKLDAFTEIEQIKLASFVLNYDKGGLNQVNEEQASELVKQWRAE